MNLELVIMARLAGQEVGYPCLHLPVLGYKCGTKPGIYGGAGIRTKILMLAQ